MFHDRSPIYQQIADKISEDILRRELDEGDQVMSTTQFAAFYRINPATVAKGFQRLIEEGVLHKRRGIGVFVSENARKTLSDRRRHIFFKEVVDPMIDEAKMIGVPLGDVVRHIEETAAGAGSDAGADDAGSAPATAPESAPKAADRTGKKEADGA